MMRLVVSAALLGAARVVTAQRTCATDAPSVEASLLQSRSAFERRGAAAAEGAAEGMVEGAVEGAEGVAEGAAEGLPGSALLNALRAEVGGAAAEGAEGAAGSAQEKRQPEKEGKRARAKAAEEDAAGAEESPSAPAEGDAGGEEGAGVTKIEPFGREDTATELQSHAAKTQDTLIDAVENAEVAEIKRSVFRTLTRLRAAEIKEFDTIARLETQAIDDYNDDHNYRVENPLQYLHSGESKVKEDKYTSFHD